MTASKIRTDYEQLTSMAQAFGQQAESTRSVASALLSTMQTLQGGDWVGKGADAFYAEMTAAVIPAMNRVVAAMNEAASTTAKISQVMKQAEDDSAALFRLDGTQAGEGSTGSAASRSAGAVSAVTRDRAGGSSGAP